MSNGLKYEWGARWDGNLPEQADSLRRHSPLFPFQRLERNLSFHLRNISISILLSSCTITYAFDQPVRLPQAVAKRVDALPVIGYILDTLPPLPPYQCCTKFVMTFNQASINIERGRGGLEIGK